jgi:hypothetical protein
VPRERRSSKVQASSGRGFVSEPGGKTTIKGDENDKLLLARWKRKKRNTEDRVPGELTGRWREAGKREYARLAD